MIMHTVGILVIIVGLFVLINTKNASTAKLVICPALPQWYLNKIQSDFKNEEAEWNLCTNILVLDNGSVHVSEEEKEKGYKQMINLRIKYPHLNISLSVRVVNFFKNYLDSINDGESATEIIGYAVETLDYFGFDGIDLDWQDIEDTLRSIESASSEEDAIVGFLKELKNGVHQANLMLTITFSSTLHFLSTDIDIIKYTKYFDLIHFMPTRMKFPAHVFKSHSIEYALMEFQPSSVRQKVDILISLGLPTRKLCLGIDFQGILASTRKNGNISTATTASSFGYNAICQLITGDNATGWDKSYDIQTKLTILTSKDVTAKRKIIIFYGTSRTVANYIKFVRKHNLAGVSAFSIAKDNYKGICSLDADTFDSFKASNGSPVRIPSRNTTKFPFMRTIHEALSLALYQKNVTAFGDEIRDEQWKDKEMSKENESDVNKTTSNMASVNQTIAGIASSLIFDSFHVAIVSIAIVLLSNV